MAGKGTTFSGELLALILNNVNAALVGDATGLRGSSTAGSLYLSLHTSTGPGAGGNQTTNEVSYTSYARVAVARSGAGWTVVSNAATLAAAATFALCDSSAGTVTYAAIGTASSGTGKVLYFGAISPTIVLANGVTPQLGTTSTVTET